MDDKELVKKYAETILLAMKLHEESYDDVSSDEAEKTSAFVDYSKFYLLDHLEAIEQACGKTGLPKELAQPIYLSFHWLNDMADWANKNK